MYRTNTEGFGTHSMTGRTHHKIPGWFQHGDLAPAGNRIHLAQRSLSNEDFSLPEFPGYLPYWVQSGTAALALALITARIQRPEVKAPTVILPAYGCPDLVAATTFAELQAVLVDIAADDPGYSLDALAAALDQNTVAVVAVNFLGIRERLGAIRELLTVRGDIALIEDNAQWYPEPASALQGDFVCLSFGRGKPVSLLGGGVLCAREPLSPAVTEHIRAQATDGTLRLKAALINTLLRPRAYWLVNRNPMFELGKTVYESLAVIRGLDDMRQQSLDLAVSRYLQQDRQIETWLRGVVEAAPPVQNLEIAENRWGRLLRFPLLCSNAETQARLQLTLDRAGLGVSAMYRRILPEIEGVRDKVRVTGDYPGARIFAERLLTLPVHAQVMPSARKRIAAILGRSH